MKIIRVGSLTQAISQFGERGTLAYALHHFFDNGGLYCYVLSLGQGEAEPANRLKELISKLQSPPIKETILADTQTGLLLVPEMSELNDISPAVLSAQQENESEVNTTSLWQQGWNALLELCHQGPPRFALLELPECLQDADLLITPPFFTALCQNGAAWWPRLQTSYRDNDQFVLLSPLPAVAAAIQRRAREQGIWCAPANMMLSKTLQPTCSILPAQTRLRSLGVSCNLIRSFTGKGVRLWGCRTLLDDKTSPWRYIQTRLLANSVARYLSKLAHSYLFEPNNAQTWMKLKGQIWPWLRQQWLAGAFFGTVEEEAFSVSIGLNETMSEADIRQGKMLLRVHLALLAPAEFIDISLTLDQRDSSANTQLGE